MPIASTSYSVDGYGGYGFTPIAGDLIVLVAGGAPDMPTLNGGTLAASRSLFLSSWYRCSLSWLIYDGVTPITWTGGNSTANEDLQWFIAGFRNAVMGNKKSAAISQNNRSPSDYTALANSIGFVVAVSARKIDEFSTLRSLAPHAPSAGYTALHGQQLDIMPSYKSGLSAGQEFPGVMDKTGVASYFAIFSFSIDKAP